MEYNITIPEYTEFEQKLQRERDFLPYMRLLEEAKPNYLIIVAVCDTPAGPLVSGGYISYMMNTLGLKIDMQFAYRQPYIAIINHGEVLYEQTSKDLTKALTFDLSADKHKIHVFSGGYECAEPFKCGAYITVDNGHPLYGGRGFNIYTYNTENNYIVDLYHYETYKITGVTPYFQTSLKEEKLYSVIDNMFLSNGGGGIYPVHYAPISQNKSFASRKNFIRFRI